MAQPPIAQADETSRPSELTETELEYSTIRITVPAWKGKNVTRHNDCRSGKIDFTQGYDGHGIRITSHEYVDIDRDGRFEVVVKLFCERGSGEIGPQQLVVIGRTAGGDVRTYGPVVTNFSDIKQIGQYTGMPDGTIQVDLRNRAICCESSYAGTQHVFRGYRWDGHRFVRSSGSKAFAPATTDTDVAVTMGDLVFGEPDRGVRTGTLSVKVRNAGSRPIEDALLLLDTANVTPVGPGWGNEFWLPGRPRMQVGGLAKGQTRTLELTFTTTVESPTEIFFDVLVLASRINGDLVRDTEPGNNNPEGTAGLRPAVHFG